MYVVIISWTGICDIAGQHCFKLFCQHRFNIAGKNADLAVIEQKGGGVFHLMWCYHIAGGNIPVSYTHLDVYKRQVPCSENPLINIVIDCFNGTGDFFFMSRINVGNGLSLFKKRCQKAIQFIKLLT